MEEHKETCSHRQTHKHITVWNAVKQRRLNPPFHHQPSTQVHSSNFSTPIQLLHYIFTSNVQYFTQIQNSSKIRNPGKDIAKIGMFFLTRGCYGEEDKTFHCKSKHPSAENNFHGNADQNRETLQQRNFKSTQNQMMGSNSSPFPDLGRSKMGIIMSPNPPYTLRITQFIQNGRPKQAY